MKQKKICIITPVHWSYAMGGIEYQVKLLTESLLKLPQIELSYLAGNIKKGHITKNYRLLPVAGDFLLRRYGYFFDVVMMLKHLKRLRPDVIYQNGGCAYTGIAAHYAKKNGCRMIWHIASDNDLKYRVSPSVSKPHKIIERQFLNYGIRNSGIIIAQSQYQEEIVRKYNSRAQIHLIKNHHPVPPRSDLSPKKNQILWVANFKQLKQPELFIQLAEALASRDVPVKALMIGSPTNYPEGYQISLENRIKRTESLRYLGRMAQGQVNRIIAESKLFINTSKWEGFPNTFIQSWMRCTPVISLNCDPDQVISKYGCGSVSGSMGKMIDDVCFLLENENVRLKMGALARRYAVDNHSFINLNRLENVILDR